MSEPISLDSGGPEVRVGPRSQQEVRGFGQVASVPSLPTPFLSRVSLSWVGSHARPSAEPQVFGELVLGKQDLQAARGWGHRGHCVTLGKSLSIFGLCPGAVDLFSPSDTETTMSWTQYF